jgi:hypothetical protein
MGTTMLKSPNASVRPYRSHKFRACDHCRRRKSRCTLDQRGQACVMCRISGVDCCYGSNSTPDSPTKRARTDRADLAERASLHEPQEILQDQIQNGLRSGSQVLQGNEETSVERASESAHIVGPILASDAQVVEQYMSPEERTGGVEVPYNVYSNDKEQPILYTKVARRRPGFKSKGYAGAKEREILEQILGPFTNELVDLYATSLRSKFARSCRWLDILTKSIPHSPYLTKTSSGTQRASTHSSARSTPSHCYTGIHHLSSGNTRDQI